MKLSLFETVKLTANCQLTINQGLILHVYLQSTLKIEIRTTKQHMKKAGLHLNLFIFIRNSSNDVDKSRLRFQAITT